ALQKKIGDRAVFQVAAGVIALKQSDGKTAESHFKSAVALEPKSAVANAFLGAWYADQTNAALAEPALKAAAELSPIRSQSRLKYAAYKAQIGAADVAKNVLKEVTSKAPDYLPAWLLSARL